MAKGNTTGRVNGDSPSSKVPAPDANATVAASAAETSMTSKVLDGTQLVLDGVGLIPGFGEVADLANAGISAARGDWVGAGLSLAAAIPFAGWGATAAKVGRKGADAVAKKTAQEAAEKAEKEAAETAKKKGDTQVKKKNSGEKGRCGEWLAKMDMAQDGFDEIVAVQNNSGHGVDLIGRNSATGEVKVWEVKTTDGVKTTDLSKTQKTMGGKDFTNDRLDRAATGKGNYGKVPEAMKNAEKAKDWIEDANGKVSYEKREVFVDDLDKGCAKHPTRPSTSKPWS